MERGRAMEMNEQIAHVLAQIEIDRVFGKLPSEKHLLELFELEGKGEDVRGALEKVGSGSTLERYLAYISTRPKSFISVRNAIQARASFIARTGNEKVAALQSFQEACKEEPVQGLLKGNQDFFTPIDQTMIVIGDGYRRAGLDEYGNSGYRRVDSQIGIFFHLLNLNLTLGLLASCKP